MIRLFGCRPSHPGSPSPGSLRRAWACPSRGARFLTAVVALFTALTGPAGSAREIHVAATGQDTAPGTLEQPLRTICAAAQRAEPGDVVTVQGGHDVYLDEEAYAEQRALDEVRQRPQTWSCAVQDNTTTIWANFGAADPNQRLAEINVRECLFMPEASGLSYMSNQWFNNLFVGRGLDDVKAAPGYRADFNVFLQGARPSTFGDSKSVVDPFAIGLRREDSASGIAFSFQVNEAPFRVKAPAVGPELVGTFQPVGQTLEDSEGHPITVKADLAGRAFDRRLPGPLATLQRGENRVSWECSATPPD